MRSVVQLYPGPPFLGAVAQLGERLVCNQEATGSIPVSSTNFISVARAFRPRLYPTLDVNLVHVILVGVEPWAEMLIPLRRVSQQQLARTMFDN